MVQMARKANEVRAEVFQFITCLPPAALVLVSTIHSSCSESTIKVKKPFPGSNRGCTEMLTIQEEFATTNYPAASDALQLAHSGCYPAFLISDPLASC